MLLDKIKETRGRALEILNTFTKEYIKQIGITIERYREKERKRDRQREREKRKATENTCFLGGSLFVSQSNISRYRNQPSGTPEADSE